MRLVGQELIDSNMRRIMDVFLIKYSDLTLNMLKKTHLSA